MQYMEISNFGPIKHCAIDIGGDAGGINILTGPQASGKSTIAKAVYFFRTVVEELTGNLLMQYAWNQERFSVDSFKRRLNSKFVELFGDIGKTSSDLSLVYHYEKGDAGAFMEIRPHAMHHLGENPLVSFRFGAEIVSLLEELRSADVQTVHATPGWLEEVREKCAAIFRCDCDTVFIPAGRSAATLLSERFPYLLSSFEEWQRKAIDYCTRMFVEMTLDLRSWFSSIHVQRMHVEPVIELQRLASRTLGATYKYEDNEERLYFADNGNENFVKMQYASSGQQEAVWVFNTLVHFLSESTKIFLIIEEPEAHLYPESQMHITDALALFAAHGNPVMITTHSPYVLGELNNLILCGQVPPAKQEQVKEIINQHSWIAPGAYNAAHIEGGICENNNAISESGLIMNELIDGVSEIINQRCDRLLDVLEGEGA